MRILLLSISSLLLSSTSAFTATTTAPPTPLKSFSPEQIAKAQSKAEADARRNFDPFPMNCLFVNVDERPTPTKCSIAPDSPLSKLPEDLPQVVSYELVRMEQPKKKVFSTGMV